MLFISIFYQFCFSLPVGFTTHHIKENTTRSFSIKNQTLFLNFVQNYDQKESNLSITVSENRKTSSTFYPQSNRFYQIRGDQIDVKSITGTSEINVLIASIDQCNEYSFGVSLTTYITTSIQSRNETQNICYLFYEPGAAYRVTFDCNANNRDAVCELNSTSAFEQEQEIQRCLTNCTTEATLADGFLISIRGNKERPARFESKVKILSVKGENKALKCFGYSIDYFNISGLYSVNASDFLGEIDCQPPEESVLIAIILVVVLIVVLASGVLMYYKCRPNREAYKSDEAARRRKAYKHKSKIFPMKSRNSENGIRDSDIYQNIASN